MSIQCYSRVAGFLLVLACGSVRAQMPFEVVVYDTNFDGLTIGTTANPSLLGHDQWFADLAVPPGYGEIQGTVAVAGLALHEFTGVQSPTGLQTVDRRPLVSPDLTLRPIIELRARFLCRTSDVTAINTYYASLGAHGGPHPGFEMLKFELLSGNGASKASGVDVVINRWDNAVCNGGPIALTVGQDLAWNAWHEIVVVADQSTGRYIGVTVDGAYQDLGANLLPLSFIGSCGQRGQRIDELVAQVVPTDWIDNSGSVPVLYETDDDVFWDDVSLRVRTAGQSNRPNASLLVNGLGYGPGPHGVMVPSGGQFVFACSGPPNGVILLLAGPIQPRSLFASLPCVGIVDVGSPPTFADVVVALILGLGPTGATTYALQVPATLPPSILFGMQGLVAPAPTCAGLLTTAFELRNG